MNRFGFKKSVYAIGTKINGNPPVLHKIVLDRGWGGKKEKEEMLQVILEKDSENKRHNLPSIIDVSNKDGYTALHIAVFDQNTELVRLLVHHGADVSVSDNDGQTPMQKARLLKREEMIRILEKL